ncbi:rhodanese-like domain-containing protein [Halosegnis marinus]|uniref:Rhodanese-like domain-containing protein n=1 Tax=Halosegnis marinus TaxID=3034023 RepID=A0ABD5ZLY2_9EURY|nr:rhodanese-like domain-containing protein [Halosegnis sp. DT85]
MDGEISAAELADLIDANADVRVVDIRSPAAFARGHIPDSVNIPFAELPQRVEELTGAERIVTVCPHGQASVQAARLVGSYQGSTGRVESLAEGIEGWRAGDHAWESEAAPTDEGPDAPF